MEFQADCVECWSEDGRQTVFFGKEDAELALTISSVPGGPGHLLEWNDQSQACANAVKKLSLSGRRLQIELLAKAAKQLGESKFGIELVCSEEILAAVQRSLGAILGERFELKAGARKQVVAPVAPPDYGKIKYLNLEGKNLKVLPPHVAEMTALEVVKLQRNPKLDLRQVFEVLGALPGVKELSVTTDEPIPENLGTLQQLESLTLDGMVGPQVLPEVLGQLRNLRQLLVLSDGDVVLPESLAELSELESLNIRAPSWQAPTGLYRLSKLTTLDLGNCRFARVPEELAGMDAVTTVYLGGQSREELAHLLSVVARLQNLETLQLATDVVPEEVASCQQIRELVVWGARELPESLGQLKGLEVLVLSLGDFAALPESIGDLENLTLLNVSENPSFETLPESVGRLQKLQTLILEENPRLRILPPSVCHLVAGSSG